MDGRSPGSRPSGCLQFILGLAEACQCWTTVFGDFSSPFVRRLRQDPLKLLSQMAGGERRSIRSRSRNPGTFYQHTYHHHEQWEEPQAFVLSRFKRELIILTRSRTNARMNVPLSDSARKLLSFVINLTQFATSGRNHKLLREAVASSAG